MKVPKVTEIEKKSGQSLIMCEGYPCQPAPHKGIGIDPGLNTVTTRAPPASMEDVRPQGGLKFHHPSSLDYSARHRLPV